MLEPQDGTFDLLQPSDTLLLHANVSCGIDQPCTFIPPATDLMHVAQSAMELKRSIDLRNGQVFPDRFNSTLEVSMATQDVHPNARKKEL